MPSLRLNTCLMRGQQRLVSIIFLSTLFYTLASGARRVKRTAYQRKVDFGMQNENVGPPNNHSRRSIPFVDFKGDPPGTKGQTNSDKEGKKDGSKVIPFVDFGKTEADDGDGISVRRIGRASRPFMDFDNSDCGLCEPKGGISVRRMEKPKAREREPCPEDPLTGRPPKQMDDSAKERLKIQNRHLALTAHQIAIFGAEEVVGDLKAQEPTNSFKILNQTGEIFKVFCPLSVIPAYYIDHVIRNFMILHRFIQPKRSKYLTDEESGWILKLLETCLTSPPTKFILNGAQCADDILADSADPLKSICVPANIRVDASRFDPIIDVVFKIFELTHTHCFPSFNGYSRVWHRFTVGIQDLFSLAMKQRWGAGADSENFWKQMLGPNYVAYNENIDKCIQSYAAKSPLRVRLVRFSEAYSIRYGANVQKIF